MNSRANNRSLAALAIVAGVLLVVLAVLYFALPAGSLPGFVPGHEAGSDVHHVKHGLVALLLGLAAFAFAWFQTGPSSPRA